MAKKKYYQRKDGLYETTRTLPNGKKKRFRGRTIREVDDKILAFREEQEQGRPFDAVADEWWETVEQTAKVSTIGTYRAYYTRAVDHFGKKNIGTIKTVEIQKFIAEQAKKGFAYSTVNMQQVVVNQIFGYAVRSGEIERNPARDVKKPNNLSKKIRQPLTVEQEKLVKGYKRGQPGLMAQMLYYTGMRIGELMALTWQDIDRKNGVIHVSKKINYSSGNKGFLEDQLKSENGRREIPILEPLEKILPRNRIGLVFADENGEHLPKHKQRAAWIQMCEELNLIDDNGNPEIVPHQLRHSFATICYEAGVDIKTVAAWMGDTEEVVAKIYQALRPQKAQKGIEQVNAYFADLAEM